MYIFKNNGRGEPCDLGGVGGWLAEFWSLLLVVHIGIVTLSPRALLPLITVTKCPPALPTHTRYTVDHGGQVHHHGDSGMVRGGGHDGP